MIGTTAEMDKGFAGSRLRELGDMVTAELGIRMPAGKMSMLRSRLQRRMRMLEMDSLDEYCDYLLHSPQARAERAEFYNCVTTNKTEFYREARHFEFMESCALPTLDPGRGKAWTAQVWCAGCSSGEEAYTLAMVLSEYAAQRPGFDFSIMATDVSTAVLEEAQRAIYPAIRVAPVDERLRKKYLLRSRRTEDGLVRVAPELRAKATFHHLNFMDPDYGITTQFSLIFFRNVAIYFDRPTQQAVVTKLCDQLQPGGYLFIGHSESLHGMDLPLAAVGPSVYRKEAAHKRG